MAKSNYLSCFIPFFFTDSFGRQIPVCQFSWRAARSKDSTRGTMSGPGWEFHLPNLPSVVPSISFRSSKENTRTLFYLFQMSFDSPHLSRLGVGPRSWSRRPSPTPASSHPTRRLGIFPARKCGIRTRPFPRTVSTWTFMLRETTRQRYNEEKKSYQPKNTPSFYTFGVFHFRTCRSSCGSLAGASPLAVPPWTSMNPGNLSRGVRLSLSPCSTGWGRTASSIWVRNLEHPVMSDCWTKWVDICSIIVAVASNKLCRSRSWGSSGCRTISASSGATPAM